MRLQAVTVSVMLVATPAMADGAAAARGAADRPADVAARPVAPSPLIVTSLGGALQDAQQKIFFAPFAASTRIAVRAGSWDGQLSTLQSRARTGVAASDRDLVLMENSSVLIACRQGLFRPIGPADPETPGCAIPALRMNLVLAWDKSRIDTAPGWTDFWDVARRPGKRGLRRDPRGTLEIALLADGVAPDEIYRTLGSSDGLDRAFRKLDQLKPYIVWWDTPAQAVQIIESGAVLMTSVPNGEVAGADLVGHRDFGIQWQQSLSMLLSWAVPGRPAPAASLATDAPGTDDRTSRIRSLLEFMSEPARQTSFVTRYPAMSVVPDVPPAGQALPEDSPATTDHQHDSLREDDGFWLAHLDAIRARFDTWLSRPA